MAAVRLGTPGGADAGRGTGPRIADRPGVGSDVTARMHLRFHSLLSYPDSRRTGRRGARAHSRHRYIGPTAGCGWAAGAGGREGRDGGRRSVVGDLGGTVPPSRSDPPAPERTWRPASWDRSATTWSGW